MMRRKVVLGACAMAMTLAAGVGWTVQANADDTADTQPAQQAQPAAAQAFEGYQIVTLDNANVGNFQRRTVYCPNGKKAIGGGAEARGNDSILNGSFPTEDGNGWIGIGHQPGYSSVGISVYVVCAHV
ncbi:hypothetical protein OG455_30085 [Kitasatospora sp. NBC_01287]|uniref:hypothetical protein n=1 Tax=Kitasatospora sp. NBC_01287 TaxID=2903573 RepID=UPI0022589E56|nr:hypothetical protein [Kitasatospora sp. NBC_01287]MCX4749713.1 hypothetical protein [Kitasatospora sp. NBC_01287]